MKKLLFIFFVLLCVKANSQTKVLGPLAPNGSSDTYGTHYDYYGIGGFRIENNAYRRDLITAARRDTGMWVCNATGDSCWILGADLTTWTLKTFGSGGISSGDTASMLANYMIYGDTAAMLSNYVVDGQLNLKLNISDTATMLSHYIDQADTAAMLGNYVTFDDNADDDNTTKGVASFDGNDFDLLSGNVNIDATLKSNWNAAYTNRITTANFPLSISSNTISADTTDKPSSLATNDQLRNSDSIAGKAITLAGPFITSGANSLTLTTTGSTNVTLPTSGTLLANSRNVNTSAPLTGGGDLSSDRTIAADTGAAGRAKPKLATIYYVDSLAATAAGTVTSVSGTSPIASSGGATPAISIANAAADGSTKGAASFTANDFNSSSGNISIDYANGQEATSSQDGFLSQTDWTTFNNKVSTSRTISTSAPLTGGGDLSSNRTIAADTGAAGRAKAKLATIYYADSLHSTALGTVTSVSASSPLASSGGATPNITADTSSGLPKLATQYYVNSHLPTPAGSTGYIQFNNLGSFSANSKFTFDAANLDFRSGSTLHSSNPFFESDGVNQIVTAGDPINGSTYLKVDNNSSIIDLVSTGGNINFDASTVNVNHLAGTGDRFVLANSSGDLISGGDITTTYVPVTRSVNTSFPLTGGNVLTSDLTLAIDTGAAASAIATHDDLRNTDSVGTVTRGTWNATSIDTTYTNAVSKLKAGTGISVAQEGKAWKVTNTGGSSSGSTGYIQLSNGSGGFTNGIDWSMNNGNGMYFYSSTSPAQVVLGQVGTLEFDINQFDNSIQIISSHYGDGMFRYEDDANRAVSIGDWNHNNNNTYIKVDDNAGQIFLNTTYGTTINTVDPSSATAFNVEGGSFTVKDYSTNSQFINFDGAQRVLLGDIDGSYGTTLLDINDAAYQITLSTLGGTYVNGVFQINHAGDMYFEDFAGSGNQLMIADNNGKVNAYAIASTINTVSTSAPTTGGTVTVSNFTAANKVENINPSGTLATLTVNLPSTPLDQQTVKLAFTKAITALTVSGNGHTLQTSPTTVAALGSCSFIYNTATTTWYYAGQ